MEARKWNLRKEITTREEVGQTPLHSEKVRGHSEIKVPGGLSRIFQTPLVLGACKDLRSKQTEGIS